MTIENNNNNSLIIIIILFVVYYPLWHNTNSVLPPTDYSKHAHTCHTEVCLELNQVGLTDTDLRRLKYKFLNKNL